MSKPTKTIIKKSLATQQEWENFETKLKAFLQTNNFPHTIGPHSQLNDAWRKIDEVALVEILNKPYVNPNKLNENSSISYFQTIFNSPLHLKEIKHNLTLSKAPPLTVQLLTKDNLNIIDYLYEITNNTVVDRIEFLASQNPHQNEVLLELGLQFLQKSIANPKIREEELKKKWREIASNYPNFKAIETNLEIVSTQLDSIDLSQPPTHVHSQLLEIAQSIVDFENSLPLLSTAEQMYHLQYLHKIDKPYSTYQKNNNDLKIKFLQHTMQGAVTSYNRETAISLVSNYYKLGAPTNLYIQIPYLIECGETLRDNKIFKEKSDLEKILQSTENTKSNIMKI